MFECIYAFLSRFAQVVCLASGTCEVHAVSREFAVLMGEEVTNFSQLIHSFT